ncbi:hypothetical protein ABH920_002200 [Catenulispora sp. EB89]
MGFTLSHLFTAGGYVGGVYATAIAVTVLVGCLADASRRADARRVLALLLFRAAESEVPNSRPRRRRHDAGALTDSGRPENPTTSDQG